MDSITLEVPTVPGTAFAGGFFAGLVMVNGERHALIVAPKAEGEHDDIAWIGANRAKLAGAMSFFDGRANTAAMDKAGSELAEWALGLRIGGFDDWYVPSRDELEILYRAFKPTTEENWCYRGDNPSSVPVGYAYMPESPARTSVDAFKEDGAEAFVDAWYWTSTQSAGNESFAWYQVFLNGSQGYYHKGLELRARAVRRLKL